MGHAANRTPGEIVKRNGSLVPFKQEKIATAVAKAGAATGEF